jgi:hypothetical protein
VKEGRKTHSWHRSEPNARYVIAGKKFGPTVKGYPVKQADSKEDQSFMKGQRQKFMEAA